MKKRVTRKTFFRSLLVLLLICQIIPIDRVNPPSDPSADLLAVNAAPENISRLVKGACYDCHSNESTYPWYAYVAPVSWWLKHHINEGREHLNFSVWGTYPEDKRLRKLKQCEEEIEEGEMPMSSYTWVHKGAGLDQRQKTELSAWFASLQAQPKTAE